MPHDDTFLDGWEVRFQKAPVISVYSAFPNGTRGESVDHPIAVEQSYGPR